MARLLAIVWRLLKGLPLAILTPFVLAFSALALLLSDLVAGFWSRPTFPLDTKPNTRSASVVIPNWNGRELLDKYLPPLIEALSAANGALGDNEIIVVDNGSTDGSAQFVRERFPQVRLVALETNLGFGGGSNAGFRAAKNDIVVLLNSDMRVDRDFLRPLLDGFEHSPTPEQTFAVSCQIFFSDPAKPRQETGLTEGWWQQGGLRVGHRVAPELDQLYPCFYGGGGSCAFDRRKFLELGGFDALYHPFYLEDTDLGYLAWKRGWTVFYEPRSIVYHEHRGTIGKTFSQNYIQGILRKNFILFAWKNIHHGPWMLSHHFFTWASATLTYIAGDAATTNASERATYGGILRACAALPQAIGARMRARQCAVILDREAFRRPMGGHFRDTFELGGDTGKPGQLRSLSVAAREGFGLASIDRLAVLFVAPYPICPPIHGGGVFMNQTVRELAPLCDLHLLILLDHERERAAHAELLPLCASLQMIVRLTGKQKTLLSPTPHAVLEYANRDLAWRIHETIYTRKIDVLQLEYMVMGQYAGQYSHIPSILFEHDVYFQSIARRLPHIKGVIERVQARWEYLRALRYELKLLPKMDRVQVCSTDNAEYIESFAPEMRGHIDDGFRAGIDTRQYAFKSEGREPFTLLFLGSFRHLPNVEALDWFLKEVFPRIRAAEPRARLVLVGSEPPPRHFLRNAEAIEMVGFVEDVRDPLSRYAVFVCPILAGSGVRVKLLEAFAAGIPVVSTTLGAEGLVNPSDPQGICALADDPAEFAAHAVRLLQHPEEAAAMAARARADVVAKRDMRTITARLMESYKAEVGRMRHR
ncbi:MAG: glycosyltransferase [Acidobacteriota bacterium]